MNVLTGTWTGTEREIYRDCAVHKHGQWLWGWSSLHVSALQSSFPGHGLFEVPVVLPAAPWFHCRQTELEAGVNKWGNTALPVRMSSQHMRSRTLQRHPFRPCPRWNKIIIQRWKGSSVCWNLAGPCDSRYKHCSFATRPLPTAVVDQVANNVVSSPPSAFWSQLQRVRPFMSSRPHNYCSLQ